LSWQAYPGETEDEAKRRIGAAWIEGAIERHRFFEMELPEVDLPLLDTKKTGKVEESD
jgi:hypothetical protein